MPELDNHDGSNNGRVVMDRKEQLKKVFEDTQKFYQENALLADAVAFGRANTKLYEADYYPELPVLGTPEQLRLMADNDHGSLGSTRPKEMSIAWSLRLEKASP